LEDPLRCGTSLDRVAALAVRCNRFAGASECADDVLGGRSYTFVVKNYTLGAAQLLQRCGNTTAYAPGIITTIALSATARGTLQAASQYRTDCAIIQNI
jgi:hypothetical protein